MSIDVLRRSRESARLPRYIFQQIMQVASVTVGTNPVQMAQARIPATTVILQADLANTGIISVGGQNITVTSGLQLDAGRAILLSTVDQSFGQMVGGLSPEIAEPRSIYGSEYSPSILVISLADIWFVADSAGQIMRCIFTQMSEGL